jgi:hypothetical protein
MGSRKIQKAALVTEAHQALTNEYLPETGKALSWRIALNSFVLLVVSYFVEPTSSRSSVSLYPSYN